MQERELGRSGIKVSAIGLGLMSMSGVYGNANDDESIAVIRHAIGKGVTFLDSADMYGWGHNETLLGKALKDGWRGKAIVATKFGQVKHPDGKQGVDGRPQYVVQACEASLKRLGIDVIDLYYQHRVDPEHADRGDRRRDEAPDRAGQGARARPVGSQSADHPPRA